MKILCAGALVLAGLSVTPALADGHAPTQGDPVAGEKAFRQCASCHVVVDDEGNTLAGKKARTGPNLYSVAGRPAGSYEGFRYSTGMTAANEAGLVWTEESLTTFIQDPSAYLKEVTGDSSARSKMSFKLRKTEQAADLYAFLYGLANPE